jgi:YmgG-like glycine-zipper protein
VRLWSVAPRIFSALAGICLLAGCATVPSGPSVAVWPGYGKPPDVFQGDDQVCRQWAGQRIGLTPGTVNQPTATGAVVGTVVGAGIGALFGAAAGDPATGAAIGAGSGLLLGTASGASAASASSWDAQQRYDVAYQQCMYARGNLLPGQVYMAPRGGYTMPPPPPGWTPPPGWQLPPGWAPPTPAGTLPPRPPG